MYHFPNITLQIFAKSPVLKTVKTRLQPEFDAEFSRDLHCALVDYSLNNWLASKVCPVQLWLAGEKRVFESKLPQWQSVDIKQQQGQDLGERMLYASQCGLAEKNNEAIILVGTDCPFIDAQYLKSACAALDKYDVVIGPADDGGYVLLGFKQVYSDLFKGIDWGSDKVYSQTLSAIDQQDLSFSALPTLFDIDRPEDILKLESIAHFTQFTNT